MAYNNYNTKGYKQLAGYSTIPAPNVKVAAPTYVVCTRAGTYSFSYPDGTESTLTSSMIPGAEVVAADGPVKLDINPVKWTNDNTPAVGDVIFVYRRMG